MTDRSRSAVRWRAAAALSLALPLLAGCGGGGGGGGTTPPPTGTRVVGVVRVATDFSPVPNVVVWIYNSTGQRVGTTTTNSLGQYSVAVPAGNHTVTLANASLAGLYYSSFYYDDLVYATTIATCRAPLPTVVTNQTTTALPIEVETRFGPPPPPPTGCR